MINNSELGVLIAEDESRILALIKSLIDWEGLHLRLVGEATDGDSALKMIVDNQPDIIITDIRMPGANGLSIAEWVNENLPSSHVIVISGYKRFDYAYDALKLSVSDFLLKPINREDLNQSLARIVDQHFSAIARDLRGKQHDSEIKRAHANLRRQCLLTLLHNPHVVLPTLSVFNANNAMSFEEGSYFAAALHIFNPRISFAHYVQSLSERVSSESNVRTSNIVAAKFKDIALRELSSLCIDSDGVIVGDVLYLIGNFAPSQQSAFNRACVRLFDVMREHCTIFPDVDFAMGISIIHNCHTDLPKCLTEATDALVCKCMMAVPGPIFAEKLDLPDNAALFPYLEKEFRSAIEVHDIFKIQSLFRERMIELSPAIKRSPLLLNNIINQLLNVMWSTASDCLQVTSFELQTVMRLYLRFAGHDLESFIESACSVLKYQYAQWFEKSMSNESLPIRIVKQYIQRNFQKTLSLDELAAQANFSISHLSAVFKRETNLTVLDYITHCRIDRAKELLSTTTMSIGEIADAVGYQDAKYFSRIFHKQVKIKPSDYRKLHQWCDVK